MTTLDTFSSTPAVKPVRAVGSFYALTMDTFVAMFRPPFALREFLEQTWFVARVSLLPCMLLSIPFVVLVEYQLNILIREVGAQDFAGTGAAGATINQIGPTVDVLVVAGAAATAMCADLGARTIREEIDAMKVMGIDPVRALVVPRVLAGGLVGLMLMAIVSLVGIIGSFFFSVYIQNVTPGAFAAGLTLTIGMTEVIVSLVRAMMFGLAASMIACYKGLSVGGGPAGVGIAVNETVIYSFMALFAINVIMTAIGVQV